MKAIFLDDLEIKIYKSHLAKKLSVLIRPSGSIRVTIPKYISYLEAEKFAISKKNWIYATLSKIEQSKNNSQMNLISEKGTKYHNLVFTEQNKLGVKLRVHNGIISVMYGREIAKDSLEFKNIVYKGIIKALRIESRETLPKRLKELADLNRMKFSKVTIKNMRTRWGSCTANNNINLNLHLMALPNHLIDYVLLHELAHTIEKNHNNKFWTLLESICPSSKIYDKELKTYKILTL